MTGLPALRQCVLTYRKYKKEITHIGVVHMDKNNRFVFRSPRYENNRFIPGPEHGRHDNGNVSIGIIHDVSCEVKIQPEGRIEVKKGVEATGFEPMSAGFHHGGSYPPRN